MNRSAAVTDIKRGLGFRQTQDTTIIAKLQEAQRELELGNTLPNFLLSYDSPITVTASSAAISLPTRFIRFHDDYELYYITSQGRQVFLPRRNYMEAYQAYIGSGEPTDEGSVVLSNSDYPLVVVQRGKTAGLLIPTPLVSFTAYLTCYVGAALLDADIENAWLANAPDVLIGLAGMWCAGIMRDKGAMEVFTQRYKLGRAGVLADTVEDELAGRGLVMGRNN